MEHIIVLFILALCFFSFFYLILFVRITYAMILA